MVFQSRRMRAYRGDCLGGPSYEYEGRLTCCIDARRGGTRYPTEAADRVAQKAGMFGRQLPLGRGETILPYVLIRCRSNSSRSPQSA